ncbi:MAG: YabP/YqfC family sporulation protein [Clostridia bacterium]|nr:YabP/YqfC family sporulation protein [Clostridia bacterium]
MKRGRLERELAGALSCSEFSVKGGKEVFAHGVKAICDYSCERVCLRLCDMTLCIEGTALTMKSYYNGAVCVTGNVRGICFER